MWKESHTDLLSGKSMFIDMQDIDSPDKSAFCSTVYSHKYTCSGLRRSNINYRRRSAYLRNGAKKRISITPAFLN